MLTVARYVEKDQIELSELRIFAGPDFIVTVSLGEIDTLRQVRRRLEAEPVLLRQGSTEILYAITEQVVNDYFPVVENLEAAVDEIETQVFNGESGVSRRIYTLFREVIQFQRATKPLVGALDSLADDDEIGAEAKRRIRVIHDHALRVTEQVSDYRELLTNILGVNQNEQTKKISAWAAIVIVPALVAGIYGMNFDFMPELHWRYGYLFALSLMALIAVALYMNFKRSDWL
jgi:magnesium transporter